jgi:hypothetical protein
MNCHALWDRKEGVVKVGFEFIFILWRVFLAQDFVIFLYW